MSGVRHDCRCRECPCTSNADASVEACPSCSVGIHRPSKEMQAHLRRGLDRWIEVMPHSLGSSGPSDKQLAIAHEVWAEWHASITCPADCPWCAIFAREAAA